jgi:hypothetical protein
MTVDQDTVKIPTTEQERPADTRPAWERIAYAWLQREVDAGQPVDPAILAGEVSVAPRFAHDLVRVLRAHRDRDPELLELRGRLVRDRITDAYLTRELAGGQQLDPRTSRRRWAPPARSPASGSTHCAPASRATGGWRACGPSRSATATQPPSSSKSWRPPTPTAAAPRSRAPSQRGGRWSASRSSTRRARSPGVGSSSRPRSPSRSG